MNSCYNLSLILNHLYFSMYLIMAKTQTGLRHRQDMDTDANLDLMIMVQCQL